MTPEVAFAFQAWQMQQMQLAAYHQASGRQPYPAQDADEWHGQSSDARGRASGSQKGNSRGKNHNEEAAWNEWEGTDSHDQNWSEAQWKPGKQNRKWKSAGEENETAPPETTAAPVAPAAPSETTAAPAAQETQLDELSRWLAPILRDPEKARKKGLERSIDGWAKLEDVQRIVRRSRLHESAHLFRQMLDWSRYDRGREAGNPRFQVVEDREGHEYIRAAKKVRSELSSPMPRSGEQDETAPPETTAAPAAAEQKPSASSSKPRCRVLPHPAYEKICLSLKSLKEMRAVMAVSKDWKQGVEPLLRCPGRKNPALAGYKQSKLPCGHSVCAKCQEERRKCPKCGALSRHAGDYVDLRSYDDPRSSLPADTASIYTTSDAPVARHYRWVCRPEESEAPFTENSELDAAEARWAKFPDHGTNLVTRYWGFLQNGLRVSAVVYCLKHSVSVRSPSEETLKDYAFHIEESDGLFLSEEEAARDILYRRLESERTERQPITRWNRNRR